jgi:hypothetical protein
VTTDERAKATLAAGHLYEIVRPDERGGGILPSVATATFGSYRALAGSIVDAKLAPGIGALLYDPENWQFTPAEEQRDIGRYVRMAVSIAHEHDYQLIASPAVTLTRVVAGSHEGVVRPARSRLERFLGRRDRYDAYLDAGLAALAAPADIVAQNAERDPRRYAEIVEAAVEQVHTVNPRAMVLAGLSTNPPGEVVTARMLDSAIRSVLDLVDGFWLNVPSPGPHCPTCNPSRPDVGISALRHVFG